jgi:uncharacterized protein (DUF1800 family)
VTAGAVACADPGAHGTGAASRIADSRAGADLRREIQAQRKAVAAGSAASGVEDPAQKRLPQFLRPVHASEVTARVQHAAATERPFLERLTQFWTNHFAVSIDKQFLAGLAGSFEREAIRPHVLGSFTDMLLAVETHPAMQLYLVNYLSAGPNSKAAQSRDRRQASRIGINENLAREILELHTLGVGGGYSQKGRHHLRRSNLRLVDRRSCATWRASAPRHTSSLRSSLGISSRMSRRPRRWRAWQTPGCAAAAICRVCTPR